MQSLSAVQRAITEVLLKLGLWKAKTLEWLLNPQILFPESSSFNKLTLGVYYDGIKWYKRIAKNMDSALI